MNNFVIVTYIYIKHLPLLCAHSHWLPLTDWKLPPPYIAFAKLRSFKACSVNCLKLIVLSGHTFALRNKNYVMYTGFFKQYADRRVLKQWRTFHAVLLKLSFYGQMHWQYSNVLKVQVDASESTYLRDKCVVTQFYQ